MDAMNDWTIDIHIFPRTPREPFSLVVEYFPIPWNVADKDIRKQYGKMTKDEAIALSKLLNASEVQ